MSPPMSRSSRDISVSSDRISRRSSTSPADEDELAAVPLDSGKPPDSVDPASPAESAMPVDCTGSGVKTVGGGIADRETVGDSCWRGIEIRASI